MSIESLWYEASPYVYAAGGAFAVLGSDGALAKVSGGVLLVAAGTIMRLRWTYRRRRADARSRAVRRVPADRRPVRRPPQGQRARP